MAFGYFNGNHVKNKKKPISQDVILKSVQLKAIESILDASHESFERKVRRWFCKNLHTPYLQTFEIPWEEILLHYYEAMLENQEYNEVFDIAVSEFLPEFVDQAEKEDEEFANSLVKEQEASIQRQKEKKAKEQALDKATQGLADKTNKVIDKLQSLGKKLEPDNQTKKPKTMKVEFDDEGLDDDN